MQSIDSSSMDSRGLDQDSERSTPREGALSHVPLVRSGSSSATQRGQGIVDGLGPGQARAGKGSPRQVNQAVILVVAAFEVVTDRTDLIEAPFDHPPI